MPKRKTQEEYVAEVAIKNPKIEVVGRYISVNTKTMHHCLIHDIYWEAFPSRVLSGSGCQMCKKDKIVSANRKSEKQYINEVKRINPHINVLGQYIDNKTPILHECTIHKVRWEAYPASILRSGGCYECGVDKLKNQKTKKHEQYVNELKNINPNILIVGIYTGAHIPILHKCLIDGYEWFASPANILSRKGCPKCAGNAKKTHFEYTCEVSIINPNIEVLEKYINAKTPILHKCLIDDYIWKIAPSDVLCGKGCPQCAGNIKKTHEQYVQEVSLINPNIKVIGQYINLITPILHRCLIHNVEWEAYPASMLRGCGCNGCQKEKIGNKLRKTHEQYISEVEKINSDVEVLGIYIGANTPILHKCKIDNYEWYAAPNNILLGYGCPQCNESSCERQIRQWLNNHNIKYEFQKKFIECRDIKPLPFDFYLPELNICIEFDGKQHYEPIKHFGGMESFEYIQKHDKIKTEYCENNDIKLLRIPYNKDIENELNNFLFI